MLSHCQSRPAEVGPPERRSQHEDEPYGGLKDRHIHIGEVLVGGELPHVFHDTYDQPSDLDRFSFATILRDDHSAVQCVAAWPEPACERFAHDRHGLGTNPVCARERTACDERNVERAEVRVGDALNRRTSGGPL